MSVQTFEAEIAGKPLKIKTGQLALQATASCEVSYGETVVLATAVISKQPREGVDYFPLMVNYEEKFYAVGKILGSRFMRREGRSSDKAILSGRIIDRTIRPLFNSAMRRQVQVVVTLLQVDKTNDPEFISLMTASVALAVSRIPWNGPVAGVKIAKIKGVSDIIINPTISELNSEEKKKKRIDKSFFF